MPPCTDRPIRHRNDIRCVTRADADQTREPSVIFVVTCYGQQPVSRTTGSPTHARSALPTTVSHRDKIKPRRRSSEHARPSCSNVQAYCENVFWAAPAPGLIEPHAGRVLSRGQDAHATEPRRRVSAHSGHARYRGRPPRRQSAPEPPRSAVRSSPGSPSNVSHALQIRCPPIALWCFSVVAPLRPRAGCHPGAWRLTDRRGAPNVPSVPRRRCTVTLAVLP